MKKKIKETGVEKVLRIKKILSKTKKPDKISELIGKYSVEVKDDPESRIYGRRK